MEFMELKSTASCLPGGPGGRAGRACLLRASKPRSAHRVDPGSGIPAPHPGMLRRTSTPLRGSQDKYTPQGESCLFQSCMCSFACMLASLVAF